MVAREPRDVRGEGFAAPHLVGLSDVGKNMIHTPSSAIFQKNAAVVYHEHGNAQKLYMGGKIGGYRTLTSTPGCDSGPCVPVKELATKVFPAPTESGAFLSKVCTTIGLKLDRNFEVEFLFVRAGPAKWCGATSHMLGNGGGASLPSISRSHASFEAMALSVLPDLVQQLGLIAAGTGAKFQSQITKSSAPKAKKFAKDALYCLLSPLPPVLASDILKLAKAKNGAANG